MPLERPELEKLDRDTLIAKAEALGVARAQVLTRPELIDELLLRGGGAGRDAATRRSRGLFGRARELLAKVVERGLHLPEAAGRLRSAGPMPPPPPPRVGTYAVPTVTLAEIYAAQGHKERAIETLERVLAAEPDHAAAKKLLDQLARGPHSRAPDSRERVGGPGVARTVTETPKNGAVVKSANPAADDAATETQPPATEVFPAGASHSAGDDPVEPFGMLDDAPLPPRYDVDECVMIPVDPETMFVYWEVRDVTRQHLDLARPGGTMALRILVILATWDGPRSYAQDIVVDASLGEYFVRGLPRGCVARAALGWKVGEVFTSIAHSPPLEAHPYEPWPELARGGMRWSLDGARPLQPGEAPEEFFEELAWSDGPAPIDAISLPRAAERARVARGADDRVPAFVFDGAPFSTGTTPLGSSEHRPRGAGGPGAPGGRGMGSSDRML